MAVPRVDPHASRPYTVINAPGGTYHVYADGRRVFVPAHQQIALVGQPTAGTGLVKAALAPRPAAAPKVPVAGAAPASQSAASAALTPDSTYFANMAQHTFNDQQALAGYTAQDTKAQADYSEALRQMAAQQPLDEQKSRESYNNQGLFYSGKMGEALNNLASSYATRKAAAASDLEQGNAARIAARQALQSGASIAQAAELAASADRQIGTDTTAADANSLVRNAVPKPKVVKVKVKRPKAKPRSVGTVPLA